VTRWRGKIGKMYFAAGLVLACFHRQVQLQMWDCRSVVSSSRRKKFKIPPAPEKNVCQLILNWDFPLHLIYLRMHHKESFL